MLLIAKPGTALFTINALYPLAGSFGLASFLVLSRVVSAYDQPSTTAFIGTATGTLVFTALLPWNWTAPKLDSDLLLLILIGVGATVANLLIALAYRYGKSYFVTPISYSSLIIVTGLGYLFFDELPDAAALFGMVVILLSGIALVWVTARN